MNEDALFHINCMVEPILQQLEGISLSEEAIQGAACLLEKQAVPAFQENGFPHGLAVLMAAEVVNQLIEGLES